MHTLYASTRQRIFTTVTFNELRSRNVDLLPLPNAMAIYFESLDRTPFEAVDSALKNLYGQEQNNLSRRCLAFEDCKVLRSVLSVFSPVLFITPNNLFSFPSANSVPKSSNISCKYRKNPNPNIPNHITRRIQEIARVDEEDKGTPFWTARCLHHGFYLDTGPQPWLLWM